MGFFSALAAALFNAALADRAGLPTPDLLSFVIVIACLTVSFSFFDPALNALYRAAAGGEKKLRRLTAATEVIVWLARAIGAYLSIHVHRSGGIAAVIGTNVIGYAILAVLCRCAMTPGQPVIDTMHENPEQQLARPSFNERLRSVLAHRPVVWMTIMYSLIEAYVMISGGLLSPIVKNIYHGDMGLVGTFGAWTGLVGAAGAALAWLTIRWMHPSHPFAISIASALCMIWFSRCHSCEQAIVALSLAHLGVGYLGFASRIAIRSSSAAGGASSFFMFVVALSIGEQCVLIWGAKSAGLSEVQTLEAAAYSGLGALVLIGLVFRRSFGRACEELRQIAHREFAHER